MLEEDLEGEEDLLLEEENFIMAAYTSSGIPARINSVNTLNTSRFE